MGGLGIKATGYLQEIIPYYFIWNAPPLPEMGILLGSNVTAD
jgi:hypothetical protein